MNKLFLPIIILSSLVSIKLTNGTQATWSPDGSKIAFVRYNSAGPGEIFSGEIYMMNASDSNVARLTNSTRDDTGPTWSPDGRRIAFLSGRGYGTADLVTMNSDGTDVLRIADNAFYHARLAWSPDGRTVLFEGYSDLSIKIFVVNAHGDNLTDLASGSQATWSPNGNKIAFRGEYGGLYIMDGNGDNQNMLVSGETSDAPPVWSPDGRKITFAKYGSFGGRASSRNEAPPLPSEWIYVINADGSNQKRLTHGSGQDKWPTWSPDGSKIAYSHTDFAVCSCKLYVMNADGSDPILLADDMSGGAIWLPDSTKIAFVKAIGLASDLEIHVVDVPNR